MSKILKIIQDPNKILHQKTKAIKNIDSFLHSLIKDMIFTMRQKEGMGLAAPQIGKSLNIAVVEYNPKKQDEQNIPLPVTCLINPKIIHTSDEQFIDEEGCLSLPNINLKIARPSRIEVLYFDSQMLRHRLRLSGLPARIVQHEIDHLNGILITDLFKQQNNTDAKKN